MLRVRLPRLRLILVLLFLFLAYGFVGAID